MITMPPTSPLQSPSPQSPQPPQQLQSVLEPPHESGQQQKQSPLQASIPLQNPLHVGPLQHPSHVLSPCVRPRLCLRRCCRGGARQGPGARISCTYGRGKQCEKIVKITQVLAKPKQI
mmetsp:Transcript_76149/g.126945  ORF Transcript_76149/g.126945 Transcript_76149/m.126945 type:complete len:118 (-) Transcript_76149:621-974(-)|eukprot:CAMPEP_0174295166 /NCGR_PEP_ID=MMETSP0809-20121228/43848_1 /TAXON_ID=73025 ORGANISM="Eutreptiella gymnastica-like, Strain CCMP1594" /NCGR_SAMPLE_ID=MMETSP0809 /ASSEMBLY_ACC=CAM_ASM_000658 /LENGTH=117 /DNA_ID=CAMNT_0015397201 /DNA_START=385 /DNA_END=738 /DNA_ORIENTATION=+